MPRHSSRDAGTDVVKCMPPHRRDCEQASTTAAMLSYTSVRSCAGTAPGSTLLEPAGIGSTSVMLVLPCTPCR
eukprot:365709-Chlamydomonas_euryale.AAC.4